MSSPWNDPAQELPDDAETVYVRQKLFAIQTPLEATFEDASKSFRMPNGELLAWQWCAAWLHRE